MSNISGVTVSSPELGLLKIMIENDYSQADADREVRDSARAAELEAMADELEAMADQADAIRTGAMIEGGLEIAGGALTVTCAASTAGPPAPKGSTPTAGDAADSSSFTLPTLATSARLAGDLAEPAGALFGKAPEQEAAREAKAAQQAQEQASWLADDAQSHRDEVEKHAAAILRQVQGIIETQNATTIAVLSNF